MSNALDHLPKMRTAEQLYLVVFLEKGKVIDHAFVMGIDQVRQKCLVHVNGNPLEEKNIGHVTEDDFIPEVADPKGAFSIWSCVGRDAWAFPVPTIPAEGRPVDEDQIMLECTYWAPGSGLCGWTGLGSEAGWDSHFSEWTCPRCGASDGLQVVDDKHE
jgi:hypothetical protein